MAGKLKKLTPETLTNAIRMYESGLSCGKIARECGITRSAVWSVLKQRVVMRPQLRYGTENHFYRGGTSEDDHAQNLVEQAIEDGVIVRQNTCELCGYSGTFKDGRTAIQAHHCDYNKPLEVMWLCQRCHHKWHKENRAIVKQ